jgi:hypothetical protein
MTEETAASCLRLLMSDPGLFDYIKRTRLVSIDAGSDFFELAMEHQGQTMLAHARINGEPRVEYGQQQAVILERMQQAEEAEEAEAVEAAQAEMDALCTVGIEYTPEREAVWQAQQEASLSMEVKEAKARVQADLEAKLAERKEPKARAPRPLPLAKVADPLPAPAKPLREGDPDSPSEASYKQLVAGIRALPLEQQRAMTYVLAYEVKNWGDEKMRDLYTQEDVTSSLTYVARWEAGKSVEENLVALGLDPTSLTYRPLFEPAQPTEAAS